MYGGGSFIDIGMSWKTLSTHELNVKIDVTNYFYCDDAMTKLSLK